jgi:hypothetical protein
MNVASCKRWIETFGGSALALDLLESLSARSLARAGLVRLRFSCPGTPGRL